MVSINIEHLMIMIINRINVDGQRPEPNYFYFDVIYNFYWKIGKIKTWNNYSLKQNNIIIY